jgi:membrane-associated phospholipid phosphatase
MVVLGIILMLIVLLFPRLSPHWQAGLWIGVTTYVVVEALTRLYLSLHWITDDLAGLLFGWMLLLVFTTATAALATDTARLVGRSRQVTLASSQAAPGHEHGKLGRTVKSATAVVLVLHPPR